MGQVRSDKERLQLYTDLFGSKRRFDINENDVPLLPNAHIPNRVEDIPGLEDLVKGSVIEDIIDEKSSINSSNLTKESDENLYILHERTHIRKISDSKSISSGDNTPLTSPKSINYNENNYTNLNYQKSLPQPQPHPHPPPHQLHKSSTAGIFPPSNYNDLNNAPNSAGNRAPHYSSSSSQDDHLQRTKSEFMPKRKQSLPQLALAGLKKQTSFSNNNSPTQSRKSPLQGFGFFSRPSSRDLNDHSNSQGYTQQQQQQQQHQQQQVQHQHQYQHQQQQQQQQQHQLQSQSSQQFDPHHKRRSMSISSSTLKSFKSSFHSKSNSRKASQKIESSTNPFLDENQISSHTLTSSTSSNNLGLGLYSRASSSSLMSKRYASISSVSTVQNRQLHSGTPTKHLQSLSSRKNNVYAALLSQVAVKFKENVQLGEHKKDGLLYRDAFTGQQAVSVICSIIRTSDRNLALLLARSLDAQKLFHDVVYEHRLRDSPKEVYEFTDNSRIIGTGTTGYVPMNTHDPFSLMSSTSNINNNGFQNSLSLTDSESSFMSEQVGHGIKDIPEENRSYRNNINGVFTLLTECYIPTCTRDKLCYSISCPRRLEQQARLNMKPNGGLKRNISMNLDDDDEERPSWTSSVSEEVWKNLPTKEIKRQEAIYEVFSTEKNFIKSLEVTRDTFMKTLSETNIIPSDIRKNFIKHVFAHINDIYSVNRRFLEALTERQKSSPVVRGIGDIILRFIPFFEPFVSYVASRPYAKYLIETQRSVNPYFARFDDDMMNSNLRHGIDSFLSQGVSRPGRYMLLVKEIMKSSDSDKDGRDYESLNKAMDALRDFMKRIDQASGAAQDRHDVKLLKQKILFKNEYVNLGLNNEKRKIKHEGILSRKELSKSDNSVIGDLQFYLLDNLLLFLKSKSVNKWHQHKVYQRPIPLPLLFATPGEEAPILRRYIGSKPDCSGTVFFNDNRPNPKNAITFLYYGAKQKYQVTLYAAQYAALQTLLDKIDQEQKRIIRDTDNINVTKISDKFFDYTNKINSVVSCDGGRKLLIATNSGLYMSNIRRTTASDTQKAQIFFSTPVQLIQRNNITQVGVLEEFKSVLLLVDKKLYSCPLSLLNVEGNATAFFKKNSKELINHVNFFAEGDCNGKRLIVTAHPHSIKYFEHEHPLLTDNSGSSKKNLKKKITEVMFDSEPVSISFLKANLCIGCKKGFQIVSIYKNQHEALLDSADTSLEFALRDTLKPMAIYRVGNMFLLCYTEFAFFVNNQGWRKKDSHIINWEGEPQKFAIWYPYILAFDNNFIEIRNIDNGELVRCIVGEKIRLLQTSSQEILYVYEDSRGYDTVASLDLWGKT
ncbi:hypothetical protein Kpol_472p5 [Vanderwaltozyma polyspora DSM 70294]|uniref:RHO1 GDP-GTP exchange protein 2 n=1 Tax=Vanderwaltozyma polyspora (strain ATCC 22028 / DSM 70294 / BCRC 21397 / CBS 2163 / NBRC 10782 / NRRL Y-8283 / UCD 57-17) TaxID=436907 RepID=A7TQH3_VANPO|nr:uncharacterized protein Kpol_472p5 [Vanderwaltozyma polyspora DSM 70294]EDO15474.1 hypothetical protein Kpol_472p5 [Vanderwaltozyma polyspora DSM 70294]